ncbi:phage antirepressor [Acetivibrio ethanolgignens]|uniref:Bro-N domain-containing protein n=1 Tax=Acetivibrio ethanolgignens TaxID=290052 RepID=A0A0V8QAT0_9FIRM|nr:phage antirepressor KilAC domain-containing protein [Acetivibrio ethanolgignens]KSV57691.1 hypothetical protein ASU35_15615 [Acetivibrio ethanolgignens]
MNELQTFMSQKFGSVRIMNVENKTYFVANDIAKALGYKNPSDATNKHCKRAIMTWGSDSLGRQQEFKVIPEGDVYRLITRSKLPSAEEFETWVFEIVLPQIRKTGGYIPVTSQDDDLTIMARAHQILERTIAQKDQIISELQPKADTYDMIMDTDGTFSMNQVAKQVGMGEYHLFAYLRGKKVLFYEGTDNVPYERFRKNGCFKVVDTISPDGKSHSTTRVTQKGLDYICKIIRKDNEEVA